MPAVPTTARRRTVHGRAARRGAAAFLVVGVLLGTAACGGDDGDGEDAGGPFMIGAGGTEAYPLECLEHQPNTPSADYTGGDQADTRAVLAMLRYYTSNKTATKFCDGAPPTEVDVTWAQLYVDLGADKANVANILPPPAAPAP